MNVRNRLKRLESRIIPHKPEICACFDLKLHRFIDLIYSGEPVQDLVFPIDVEPCGEVCAECRQPVNPRLREMSENLRELYG